MQALLLGSILVLTSPVVVRFGLFFRNQYARLPYRYPTTWTAEQAKTFARLRLAIGGCLAIIWLTFLLTAPQLPVSWPFRLEEALLTIGLLLLTNGWLVLLVRLNWENSLLSQCRFRTGFTIVALWWIAAFAAILATIGWATMPHIHFVFPRGTIA
jgi:preprotein translocase subunit SecY